MININFATSLVDFDTIKVGNFFVTDNDTPTLWFKTSMTTAIGVGDDNVIPFSSISPVSDVDVYIDCCMK